MEIIRPNKNNLASIIMGKNITFPWRGQSDILISVSFDEWFSFIKSHYELICNRSPLDYSKILNREAPIDRQIRFFWFEISWALYSELALSSNVSRDATLILPYFVEGSPISIVDIIHEVNAMDSALVDKYHNNLKAATRNYYNLLHDTDMAFGLVDLSQLSDWNMFVFKVCIYLQSKSSHTSETTMLNINI